MDDAIVVAEGLHKHYGTTHALDGLDLVVEARVRLEVLDVLDAARGEVVDDVHLVAARDVRVGQMRADESRPAGDQHFHGRFPVAVPLGPRTDGGL